MANTYVDLATFKGTGGLNLGTGTAYDKRLLAITENVSREVDRYCDRHFFYTIESIFLDGDGSTRLIIPDIIAVGTLLEDTNRDGTFETGWSTNDYYLAPQAHNPTARDYGKPYTQLVVNDQSVGGQDVFMRGRRTYSCTGTWGYTKVSRDTGMTGSLTDATSTGLILGGSATGTVEIGHTILIDNELVYVTGITTGTLATVDRGLNGSTATAHLGKAINVIQYPGPVVEAVFNQTSRLWRRKDAAFAAMVGMPESGQMMTWTGELDADAKMMLSTYRRRAV